MFPTPVFSAQTREGKLPSMRVESTIHIASKRFVNGKSIVLVSFIREIRVNGGVLNILSIASIVWTMN